MCVTCHVEKLHRAWLRQELVWIFWSRPRNVLTIYLRSVTSKVAGSITEKVWNNKILKLTKEMKYLYDACWIGEQTRPIYFQALKNSSG